MKTLKQYEKSNLGLHEFLKPMDRIDWYLYEHIMCGYVAPNFDDGKFAQGGECNHSKDGTWYYNTVMSFGEKYYYLGLMGSLNPSVYYRNEAEDYRYEY